LAASFYVAQQYGHPESSAAAMAVPLKIDPTPSKPTGGLQLVASRLQEQLGGLATLPERIAAIVAAVPGRVAFSTSLGLEDQAVLDAIASSGRGVDVFTLDTGRHFPETLDTIDASERHFRIKIRVVAPDASETEALVARDGVLGFRSSIDARKACCDIRKVRPLNRALTGAAGWMTGLRRGQSAGRAEVPFAEWDAGLKLIKLNPIADWSLETLQSYVAANAVPVNALHGRGFPSIGCAPCTRAVQPGEDIRAGRWWWENADGKECGLHNGPKARAAAGDAKECGLHSKSRRPAAKAGARPAKP
jgi:phosphoadenosine phosphosulfate reductase